MLRHLLNMVAALSLALLVSTAVLWVRSHRYTDSIQIITRGGGSWEFYSVGIPRMRLGIEHVSGWPEPSGIVANTSQPIWGQVRPKDYHLAILFYNSLGGAHSENWSTRWIWGARGQLCAAVDSGGKIRRMTPNSHFTGIEVTSSLSRPLPFWYISANPVAVMLLCSVLPLWAAGSITYQSLRRDRRASLRLCATCGYSLRGNTSGVCPECGSSIKGAA